MRYAALTIALVVVGCGWIVGPGILTITSHHNVQVVHQRSVTIEGSASPNARIVQEIAGGPNEDTTADGDGRWTFRVELSEGRNVLTFRIGDHLATAKTIVLIFEPN